MLLGLMMSAATEVASWDKLDQVGPLLSRSSGMGAEVSL